MDKHNRRGFIKNSAGAVGASIFSGFLPLPKYKPLLSFSTLGCPDWSFDKIVSFAKENNYQGLEIRGVERELDLAKSPLFNSPQSIANTSKLVRDNGLKIVNLGSSAALHHSSATERQKNLDEAKRFIELASQLNCPYIRVFPNDFPPDQDRKATIDLIVNGLLTLGDFAKDGDVTVLLESHGQVVRIDDLETIMRAAEHKNVGMIWDIVNMWVVTKEAPTAAYKKLKKYIRHVHIKDLKMVDGKEQYVLLGSGESPVVEGIKVLINDNYKGYFSFEWEKLWHPEIAEPEVALAHYPKTIKALFNTKE